MLRRITNTFTRSHFSCRVLERKRMARGHAGTCVGKVFWWLNAMGAAGTGCDAIHSYCHQSFVKVHIFNYIQILPTSARKYKTKV